MVEVIFIVLGLLGGLARALYGLFKAMNSKAAIQTRYFVLTLFVSAAIGGLLGQLFSNLDFRVAALAGYVGTDILENIVKTIVPKSLTLKNE